MNVFWSAVDLYNSQRQAQLANLGVVVNVINLEEVSSQVKIIVYYLSYYRVECITLI